MYLAGKKLKWASNKLLVAFLLPIITTQFEMHPDTYLAIYLFSAVVYVSGLFDLGEAGDVLVALSTSGNSKNVIEAIKCADTMDIYTIVLTGKSGGLLKNSGTVTIRIPSDDTQRIQEGHITVGHILCELVENSIR